VLRKALASVPALPLTDRGLTALQSAARAAIVMPANFAIADKVIENQQTALFASFGSFAMLVLADFRGPPRSRLAAYASLGCAGAALITLGTICSRSAWLAAGAMAVVGFAILLSGAVNGYAAAGGTAAMLTFVLPVTLPAPASDIPARLGGWALAAGVGICALMLLWPPRQRARLAADAATACLALADLAEPVAGDNQEAAALRETAAREAVTAFRKGFLATPHRPSGPTGPTAAIAALVDELDWLRSFLAPKGGPTSLELCRDENAEALAASADVLRASAARLTGGHERPDLARLDRARDAVALSLARRIAELPEPLDDELLQSALEPSFRIRALSYSARQVAGYALLATGAEAPELDATDVVRFEPAAQPVRSTAEALQGVALEHTTMQSVWFQNSLRGAIGLAIAVYIARRTGVQHAFWVVLGTLSVLRSNALGTGWSILTALAGTAVGIVIGAGLIVAIGTHQVVLWLVLPPAVLLAAYAPRAISFAAGQAGFSVVLFILFSLIQPTGWTVGLVRIEDVAIGFAISLGVGLLFWPRGAAALLRESIASAYARAADFVVAGVGRVVAGNVVSVEQAAAGAAAAEHHLDDVFRQYLAERSATRVDLESVAALVAGAGRVRRAAQSLLALGRMVDGSARLDRCGANLDAEVHAVRSWYVTLGDSLVHATPAPPPHIRDVEGRRRLLACVHDALRGGVEAELRPALVLLWAEQHLDNLWRLETHLRRAAAGTSPVGSAG
jgi:uncharacterized membrane protein YccC